MPLPVSTREWIPSEIIAELPVIAAATNLIVAIARFPMIAATIAFFDSAAMAPVYTAPGRRGRRRPASGLPRGRGRGALDNVVGLGDPWLHGLKPERTR